MASSVTIVGLGLIGGSIGKALRRETWYVHYVDPNVDLRHARDSDAADERVEHPEGDIVILATPVDVAMNLEPKGRVITTTCSVMAPFKNYVAGHPFAGSEKNGLEFARADLFEGHPWFISREDRDVRAVVEACGAKPVVCDSEEHDAAMALTSHLPQVLSTALASLVDRKNIDPMFIGAGLKTLLRLAASSYEVWGSVLDANARNIAHAEKELLRVINSMTSADFDRARHFMAKYVEGERASRPHESRVSRDSD